MTNRKIALASLAASAMLLAACQKDRPVPTKATEEEGSSSAASGPLSVVAMNDAKHEVQLVNGFYTVEANAWRWTAGKFAVMLKPPVGAAEKGATLKFEFSVPEGNIQKLKSITLGASVGGTELGPETYTKDGAYEYKRDVPANLLTGNSVRVDFHLDKTYQPGGADQRELGVVARQVELDAK